MRSSFQELQTVDHRVHIILDVRDRKIYTVAPSPNTADIGTDEKAAVFGKRRYSENI